MRIILFCFIEKLYKSQRDLKAYLRYYGSLKDDQYILQKLFKKTNSNVSIYYKFRSAHVKVVNQTISQNLET